MNKGFWVGGGLFLIILLGIGISWIVKLHVAHSTFENYYAFRGCTKLMEKTETYGICEVKNGKQIKIVKYQNKWYLDGDLPWGCIGKVCFGW